MRYRDLYYILHLSNMMVIRWTGSLMPFMRNYSVFGVSMSRRKPFFVGQLIEAFEIMRPEADPALMTLLRGVRVYLCTSARRYHVCIVYLTFLPDTKNRYHAMRMPIQPSRHSFIHSFIQK